MLLADVDPTTASTKVNEAITTGVFQSNSDVVRAQLAAAVSAALAKWEPRITHVNVSVQQGTQPSQVLIVVDYQISSTNELFNLVYPLYLQEGAG